MNNRGPIAYEVIYVNSLGSTALIQQTKDKETALATFQDTRVRESTHRVEFWEVELLDNESPASSAAVMKLGEKDSSGIQGE